MDVPSHFLAFEGCLAQYFEKNFRPSVRSPDTGGLERCEGIRPMILRKPVGLHSECLGNPWNHMITSSKSSKSSKSFLGTTNVSMGPVQQSGMQTDVFSDLKCWVATAAL